MLIGQVSFMVNLARTKINLEKVWLAACMPSMSYKKILIFLHFLFMNVALQEMRETQNGGKNSPKNRQTHQACDSSSIDGLCIKCLYYMTFKQSGIIRHYSHCVLLNF